MTSNTVMRCEGIHKAFGEGRARHIVLRGVGFAAQAGQVTFVVGPSGCGKTTLVSIVGTLLQPDAGQVWIGGQDATTLSQNELADLRLTNIGFAFQQFNLIEALSTVENVALPLVAQGQSMSTARKTAMYWLARFGMTAYAAAAPVSLSSGQQQRVSIARSLVHRPGLVICDEPTAMLDATSGLAVIQQLSLAAKEHQQAIIVVTHDHRISHFADRMVVMDDGKLQSTRTRPRRAAEVPSGIPIQSSPIASETSGAIL